MTILDSCKGTYALLFSAGQKTCIQVGKLGQLKIEEAFYIYVGSAFGSGGVKSRIERHLRKVTPKRWHIDYVKHRLAAYGVWYSYSPLKLECHWANILYHLSDGYPLKKMGSSDCKCPAHFFRFRSLSFFRVFSEQSDSVSLKWIKF